YAGLLLQLRSMKRFKIVGASVVSIFIIVNMELLVNSNAEIRNIISVSSNGKNVFSIKDNKLSGETCYYRSYYGVLARPKEQLPTESVGDYKVEWLANDVAAFTYQTTENITKQFIGTYGDRKNGLSYYN